MGGMQHVQIHGSCAPRFELVRREFERNFTERGELGAAVAVFVDDELVVNLWGGWADPTDAPRRRPWAEDTLSTVLSGSKALTSTCVHRLVEAGELDLHAPVARYWPRARLATRATAWRCASASPATSGTLICRSVIRPLFRL